MLVARRPWSTLVLLPSACTIAPAPDIDSDADADTDADTDVETGDTAPPTGPLGMIARPGEGVYTAGKYTGVEHAGVYQFNNQIDPTFTDYTALCQFTWDATDAASDPAPVANLPDFSDTPCPDCTFAVVVALHGGTESGPPAACAPWGITATYSEGLAFAYGYREGYFTGVPPTFVDPMLMVLDEGDPTSVPPRPPAWFSNGPATYNPATGEFSYVLVHVVGYL
jgi:hypothetical protein